MMNNMRKIFFILLLICGTFQLAAQDRESHRERIKALKTAYITEGLNLTAKEAQKFWPIYNEFDAERRKLYRREHADILDIECYTEENAEEKIREYVEIERQDYLLKKKFFEDLRTILPATRILKLKKVEDDFNRKMLKEYRERHANKNKSSE